ncbi:hypothetical protein SAMN05216223_101461 [Actinacidiphila yanglinensis]|uniref:Uncharacterized protein n=1 Tax=Actinacidiphila yanglinensis TaxID=310779 RepID=A0A1H5TDL4_9ACTN|nr:hypothetical protein [Actinacidiphila yanglinensis]SEF60107.1 hypothetical protein SAMN05216223_101461 [Actinacidiphila yanglinensis]
MWRSLTVRPLVLGPANVPIITDQEAATHDIPLAVFSAITHGSHPQADTVLKALHSALKTVDELTASIFTELTELGLGTSPAATIWRDLMAVDLTSLDLLTTWFRRALNAESPDDVFTAADATG